MLQIEDIADVVASEIKEVEAPLIVRLDALAAENAALAKRIAELEKREITVDLPDFDEIVSRHVAEAVANLPEPEPGQLGTSVTLDDVTPMIDEAVAKAVAEIPPVEPPPAPEPIAPDMDAINATIERTVAEHVAQLPAPQDGKSVTIAEVEPMLAEMVERAVGALPAAKDGVGAAGAVIDRDGNLVLTLTDGSQRDLGRVVGKDADRDEIKGWIKAEVDAIPRPKDGKNGFELDDFGVEAMPDGRTIKLHFDQGDTRHSYELEFPVAIYRGVFREGQEYAYGDMVTFGGSIWHCNNAGTAEKPGASADWTLSVKKGRDVRPASINQETTNGAK